MLKKSAQYILDAKSEFIAKLINITYHNYQSYNTLKQKLTFT